MRNHIIFFSGGKSSFTVAHLVKERFPEDNILLYFTDTLWEDEDLYRFIYEASDKLELPMLYHSLGLNPIQLMHKQAVVFNSRIGNCSTILKMGVAADYFYKGIEPPNVKYHNPKYLKQVIDPLEEGFKGNTTVYFGIGWEEMHREAAIKKNWQPFEVEMPLIEEIIDNDEILASHNIKQPQLYDMGFAHNNCKGRCVKAGQGHFINLLQQMPDLFQKTMAFEHHMSNYVSTHHYYRNQKYFPECEQFDDDTLEILLADLNDAYEDYFWDRAPKPKPFVHPTFTAVPFEVDKLLIDYVFVKEYLSDDEDEQMSLFDEKNYKWKRVKVKKFVKSTCYKLIETRHLKHKSYSYMKRRKDGISKPYPLRNLYWDATKEGLHMKPKNVIVQHQKSEILDLFDVGGCGCDFSQTDASACDLMAMIT